MQPSNGTLSTMRSQVCLLCYVLYMRAASDCAAAAAAAAARARARARAAGSWQQVLRQRAAAAAGGIGPLEGRPFPL